AVAALVRPPPTATLFPYTTLFRSSGVAEQHRRRQLVAAVARPRRAVRLQQVLGRLHVAAGDAPLVGRLVVEPQEVFTARRAVRVDRKSTRLNSSHVKRSYAVFCWQ